MADEAAWPTEIRLGRDRSSLILSYGDGRRDVLDAEYLRVESPSAEVQGHTPDQKVIVAGKKAVAITAVDAVGSYAVRLTFSDGHSTGIFTWPYLRKLADERDKLWGGYLEALAARGLTR
jgi:DUF971 family protein